MAIGPALMALGLLWFERIPATARRGRRRSPTVSTLVPPVSYVTDVLPANLVFAFGIAMLVAPLTTALMTSVPMGNSGLASAINNALSRIGPMLAGAVIFIGVSASFYGGWPTGSRRSTSTRRRCGPTSRRSRNRPPTCPPT